jgi:carbon-monoxide dehydrogenase medium subunit
MKPSSFEYLCPDSLDEALSLIAEHGYDAKLLAGGQSLIPLMNFRLAKPAVLIDLNRIESLRFLRAGEDGGIEIGAMTRQRALERDALLAQAVPLFREAVPFIAHPQIRNRGTIGGSLAHADPASELPALAVATDARFKLQNTSGSRWVEAKEFYVGLLTTDLQIDEILTAVAIPAMRERTGWAFMEIARRLGDYAQVGVVAQVSLDASGSCSGARLVYLSVGDGPIDAEDAAAVLIEGNLTDDSIEAAAHIASTREVEPAGDIHASEAYKRHLAQVLTVRAVERAVTRARNGEVVPK